MKKLVRVGTRAAKSRERKSSSSEPKKERETKTNQRAKASSFQASSRSQTISQTICSERTNERFLREIYEPSESFCLILFAYRFNWDSRLVKNQIKNYFVEALKYSLINILNSLPRESKNRSSNSLKRFLLFKLLLPRRFDQSAFRKRKSQETFRGHIRNGLRGATCDTELATFLLRLQL